MLEIECNPLRERERCVPTQKRGDRTRVPTMKEHFFCSGRTLLKRGERTRGSLSRTGNDMRRREEVSQKMRLVGC